jgi:hypothetical protein
MIVPNTPPPPPHPPTHHQVAPRPARCRCQCWWPLRCSTPSTPPTPPLPPHKQTHRPYSSCSILLAWSCPHACLYCITNPRTLCLLCKTAQVAPRPARCRCLYCRPLRFFTRLTSHTYNCVNTLQLAHTSPPHSPLPRLPPPSPPPPGRTKASTLSLSVLVAIEMFNAFNALSEDNSLLQLPPWSNPWLLLATCISLGLHCVILYVPFLAQVRIFNLTRIQLLLPTCTKEHACACCMLAGAACMCVFCLLPHKWARVPSLGCAVLCCRRCSASCP